MKKVCFAFILISFLLSSCSPSKFFLVDSYGILTYDRMTGKWEVMWEFKTKQPVSNDQSVIVTDSLVVDSVSAAHTSINE